MPRTLSPKRTEHCRVMFLVVEVTYDHFTGGSFRHGTKIILWRPDKTPMHCTMEQVERGEGKSFALL